MSNMVVTPSERAVSHRSRVTICWSSIDSIVESCAAGQRPAAALRSWFLCTTPLHHCTLTGTASSK